jgi:hypothetical protein
MGNEKFDAKYKDRQKDNWDSKDHNKDEKVANPTVNRFDKDALEKGKKYPENHDGKNSDGDKKDIVPETIIYEAKKDSKAQKNATSALVTKSAVKNETKT